MTYRPSAALAVRLARRTTNSNPLWWSTAAAPPPPTPAPCAATTAATAHLRHAASVTVVARVGAPSFVPFCVAPRPGPRGGGRGAPRGTVVPPTRSARSSSSTVGADDDRTAGGPPSEAQVTAALNDINERFSEARLLLGEARDALGSVYFEDDFKDAQEAVAHTLEAWNALLASVSSDPDTAGELRRSTGQKMKQLDEELKTMTDALIHDD